MHQSPDSEAYGAASISVSGIISLLYSVNFSVRIRYVVDIILLLLSVLYYNSSFGLRETVYSALTLYLFSPRNSLLPRSYLPASEF